MNKKYAVLSLSGGMDSSTLLLHLLNEGYEVIALSFDYGQKHRVELERAKELVDYINSNKLRFLVHEGAIDEYYHKINHQVIELKGLSQLLNSTLVEGGNDVPEGHYEQENMKDTVVPNRNKIFSSIIQAVALSISKEHPNSDIVIALGIHAGDFAVYKDCRKEFRDADYNAFIEGNIDAELVKYYIPYIEFHKYDILKDGLKCCENLGLDFNEVYKRTNTSYKPIKITYPSQRSPIPGEEIESGETHKWYSDYKSAASVERIEAFIKLGIPDPVEYADETGPISWEVAKNHVEKTIKEFWNKHS